MPDSSNETVRFFQLLPGSWRVRRTIIDNTSTQELVLLATFSVRDSDRVHYSESGIFTVNDREFQVSREYEYCYDRRGQVINVYKEYNYVS